MQITIELAIKAFVDRIISSFPIEDPVYPDGPIVIEPPIEVPPIIDIDFNFDYLVENTTGILYLPKEFSNKEIIISSRGMLKPAIRAIVGNNVKFTFASWDQTPTQLFNLSETQEFGIIGVTFVQPANRPVRTGYPDAELFGWARNTVKRGKFALINSSFEDTERTTYGLARFAYSSEGSDKIYLIGKNISHNGFNFTQIKNPYAGNLNLILQNVNIFNPIIEGPQSHYYSPTRIPVTISVQGGISTITSDNTYDQILTWIGYNNGNQRSIVHFDRYAFDISEDRLIDNKNLILQNTSKTWERISERSFRSDYELHPLDVTSIGTIITKQVEDIGRVSNWLYTVDQDILSPSGTFTETPILPSGTFPAYIVYKGNAGFSNGGITASTEFGEGYWESGVITISQGYGWTWYNEEFSGYIENYHGDGYHRNSGGTGVTTGLTIRNSTFEQNPPISTSTNDMPQEAQDYIEYLENLLAGYLV